VFVAILLALPFTSLLAQNRNTGEIRGTITDSSGARAAGARVVVTNTDTGITTTLVAGEGGSYDAPLLEPGPYSIEFSKEGFKKFVRQGITLHVEVIAVDAVLKVGSINESVTVTADVPLVQTETSERSAVFVEKTVNDLPNVGRNWFDILGQLPGVNPGGSQDASGQSVGVNGAAPWQENFLTDGGVNTLPVSQNPGTQTPLDDIAEVDMSTSNFSAEYGSGVAVFNVITKSGTNRFHGSLYEFWQNDILEARNYFAQSTTPLRWNMYGGTIGGPIRRNKAFFFFSYQSNPSISDSPTFYTFPTAAMKAGDFSDPSLPILYDPKTGNPDGTGRMQFSDPSRGTPGNPQGLNIVPLNRFDPVAAKIQAYFPLPNLPGTGNNYYYVARNTSTGQTYNAKIDYNLSASNSLSGSLTLTPGSSFSPSPTCPIASGSTSGCGSSSGNDPQVSMTDAWTFSPKLINEARVSFLRQYGVWSSLDQGHGFAAKIGLPNPPADTFPNIGIGGVGSTSIGGGLNAVLGFNSFMYSDSVTWIKGKHAFKFGGEFNRWQDNQEWSNIDSGDYDFSGVFTQNPADPNPPVGSGYADFLLGLPDSWGVAMQPLTGLRAWNVHAFAQDDYKMTPHLTLNLGVRYVRQAGWSEVENRIGNFDPTLLNPATGNLGAMCFAGQTFGGHQCPRAQQQTRGSFQPRVGFAWSPKDTWSIRGGYGIFDIMQGANNYTTGFAYGWSIQGSITSPDNLTPVFPLSQGPPPGSIIYPSAAARTPDSFNGQGVSYLPYHTPVPYVQQWQFGIQHQIPGHIGLDAAYVGSRGVHLLFGRNINQVPAALLGPNDFPNSMPYPQFPGGIGANLYDGISTYHSLQLSARTVVSHGVSFRVNFTLAKALDENTSPGWSGNTITNQSYQNAYDPRANYGLASFDVPRLLNGNVVYELPFGQGKTLLDRGGLLNGFVGGWQLSGTFQVHSGLPFTPVMADNLTFSFAGDQYPNRVGHGTLAHPTPNLWFDPTAFVSPGLYKFGDSGRDILRGPAFRGVNLSLAKHFKLGEHRQLEMRADAYDVFNHANFGMPDPVIGDGTTGAITSTASSFANPGSRNLQLGAKFSF
jgi:hypothetical protein